MPELPGLRLVLKEMSDAREIPNLDLPEDCQVEATDAQLEECENRQRERKGTIANAHIYASERNCDAMDVFVHATMPLKTMYSDKIFNVKTPADGLGERLAYANGRWEQQVHDIAKNAFHNMETLKAMSVTLPGERGESQAQLVGSFVLELCKRRAATLLADFHQYPGSSVVAIPPCQRASDSGRQEIQHDWDILLMLESVAPQHIVVQELIIMIIISHNQ